MQPPSGASNPLGSTDDWQWRGGAFFLYCRKLDFALLQLRVRLPRAISISNSTTDKLTAEELRRRGLGSAFVPLLWVALAATAVIAPMLALGQASGHDFQFHLASWLDVAGQWREGILFPRWAEWANWGFGEPRFIFYPPASWMLGAGLGSILPWRVAPGAFVWLALVLAGFSMWRFASDYLPRREAIWAAVFYAVNPYNLVNVYYRSDFAELLALAIFPLVIWGVVRVLREGWRSLPKLALPCTAIWLSNAPAAVLATYSLALIIFVDFVRRRSFRAAVTACAGMVGGFGLAAFYIFPAAWEQRWVQIDQVVTDLLRPDQNFLYTHADNPEFLFFNWKVSTIAAAVILAAGISAVFVARRRRELGEAWWYLLALGSAAILMMLPASDLAWRLLPKLRFVQFPWRWLGPLDFVLAFFLAAAFQNARRQWLCWTATFVLVAGLGAAMVSDAWWDSEDIPVLMAGIQSGHGYEGTDEYQPLGSSRYDLPGVSPDGDIETGPATKRVAISSEGDRGAIAAANSTAAQIGRWKANWKEFSSAGAEPVVAAVELLNYPAWKATVDGAPAEISVVPGTGQMLVQIPSGTHRVVLRFGRTWDRLIGGIVSIFFLLVMAALAFATKRGVGASKAVGDAAEMRASLL
jgi:hypothetical protein